jgi:hypothetical protein
MECLHRDGEVTVTLLESWHELTEQQWETLGQPRHPFESAAWLLATAHPQARVFVAWLNGQAIAALPLECARAAAPPLHTAEDIFVGPRAEALMRGHGKDPTPLLAAREANWKSVAVVLSPFAFRGVLRGERQLSSTLPTLLKALEIWGKRHGLLGIAFPYLREQEDGPLISALSARGAHLVLLGAGCSLSVPWRDPAGYFTWLGRRRVRQTYAQTIRSGAVKKRLLQPGEALEASLQVAARDLLLWDAQRHGSHHPPKALYGQLLDRWPEERLLTWIEGRQGQMEACALAFIYHKCVISKFGGHLHEKGRYLELCLTSMVIHAIEERQRFVDLGASNHQAKLLRGGEIYWIVGALLSLDPTFHQAVSAGLEAYSENILSYISAVSHTYAVDRRIPGRPVWLHV